MPFVPEFLIYIFYKWDKVAGLNSLIYWFHSKENPNGKTEKSLHLACLIFHDEQHHAKVLINSDFNDHTL